MTIREYLRQRIKRIRRFALMAWLVMFSCALGIIFSPHEVQAVVVAGLILSAAVFAGFFVYLYTSGIRCPRCQGKFGPLAPYFGWRSEGLIKFCPFCGTSIDEEVREIAR